MCMILVPLCSCSFITRSSQPHIQFRDSGQQPSGTLHHQSTRVVVASGTYRVGERTLGRVITWPPGQPSVQLVAAVNLLPSRSSEIVATGGSGVPAACEIVVRLSQLRRSIFVVNSSAATATFFGFNYLC